MTTPEARTDSLPHRQWLPGSAALLAIAVFSLAVNPANARITAILQTYDGAGTAQFATSNGIPLGTDSLLLAYRTTRADGTGFNPANPLAPTDGDLLLAAAPLNESGFPAVPGQIVGHLAESFDISGTGHLYVAVFDYSHTDYLSSGIIPVNTPYLLTTGVLVAARSAENAGQPTDFGRSIMHYVLTYGPFRAGQQTESPEKDPQIITDFLPAPGTYDVGQTLDLSATGGESGNPVTFTNLPGGASITWLSTNSFTSDQSGMVRIVADQAGNELYHPAPTVTNTYIFTCASLAVTPTNFNIGAEAQILTNQVSATPGCAWAASILDGEEWLELTPASGTGDGNVILDVEKNPSRTARTGIVLIGNTQVTIEQEGNPAGSQGYLILLLLD